MLVTLSEIKSYLNVTVTDHDTFLTEQGNLISDIIEAYCRRSFSPKTYEQSYFRNDYRLSQMLQTFHYPLLSVASIVEDGVTLDPTLYRVHKPSGNILQTAPFGFGAGFAYGPGVGGFFRAIETVVTYDSGLATIPSAIKASVFQLVEERYNKRISGVALNFGREVQRIAIPGAISVDFDFSLKYDDRKIPFGVILGNTVNMLDYYRSDRAILGSGRLTYVTETGDAIVQISTRILTGTGAISAQTDKKIILNDVTVEGANLQLPPGADGMSFTIGFASTNAATWTAVADGTDTIDAAIQPELNVSNNLTITFISGVWYLV